MTIQKSDPIPTDFVMYAIYPRADSAGPGEGFLLPGSASIDDVKPAGDSVPGAYERVPIVQLIVDLRRDQHDIVLALQKLTGRELLDHIHRSHPEVNSERLPRREYEQLDEQQRKEVHALIRRLAGSA